MRNFVFTVDENDLDWSCTINLNYTFISHWDTSKYDLFNEKGFEEIFKAHTFIMCQFICGGKPKDDLKCLLHPHQYPF